MDVVLTEDEVQLIRNAAECLLAELEGTLFVPDEYLGLIEDTNALLDRVTVWEELIEDEFYPET